MGDQSILAQQSRMGKRFAKRKFDIPKGYVSKLEREALGIPHRVIDPNMPLPVKPQTVRSIEECVAISQKEAEQGKNRPVNGDSTINKVITRVSAVPTPEEEEMYRGAITIPKGEFMPNKGTIFEGMQFLSGGTGRTQTITEDDLQAALYIAREGGSRSDCADVIGVAEPTLVKLEAKNPMWAAAFRRAQTLGKLALIRRIRGGDSHWQAAAWMLERRYRKEYGANVPIEEENRLIRVRPVTPKVLPNTSPKPDQGHLSASERISPEEAIRRLEQAPLATGATEKEMGSGIVEQIKQEVEQAEHPTTPVDEEPIGTTNLENGTDQLIDTDGTVLNINIRRNGKSSRKPEVEHTQQIRKRRLT
jgi:hypothetical protein